MAQLNTVVTEPFIGEVPSHCRIFGLKIRPGTGFKSVETVLLACTYRG